MSVSILIGGDVVPTQTNLSAFAGDASALLGNGLRERWLAADARFFNLEAPLFDGNAPIEKCGPHLAAPTRCAAGLQKLRPTAVSLANNHVLDHGAEGLAATVSALDAQGVSHFGAGADAAAADTAFFQEISGVRLCVYAVCEHEYSVATEHTPGANAFDALELSDRVRALKSACDRLILLYHGGRECYPYPSPLLQKRCRKAAEAGADLVLCQHSHCVGCREEYRGATIVYGQGNLLFDVDDGEPCFDSGLIVRYDVEPGGEAAVSFLPVVRRDHGVALAEGDEAAAVLDAFFERSGQIAQPGFVQERYAAYAGEMRERLLRVFLSGNPLLKTVNRLSGRRPTRVYDRAALVNIRNTVMCESLNELLTEGLK